MNCLLCVFSRLLDVCRTICKTQGERQPNREFTFYLGKKPIFCGFLPFSSRIFAQKNAKKAFFFSNRNCQKKKRLFVDTFLCCLHPLRPTTHRRHRHKKYVSNDTTFSPYVNNFEKTFSKKFLAAFCRTIVNICDARKNNTRENFQKKNRSNVFSSEKIIG